MNEPAITQITMDEGPQRLWAEWLGAYFDGFTHVVAGLSGVEFPLATIGFDVAKIPQPLSGVGVVVVAEEGESERHLSEVTGHELVADATWLFYMRAGITSQANAKHLVRRSAQLLKALLLDDDATLELARRGITELTVEREKPLPSMDVPLRQVRVTGRVRPTTTVLIDQTVMPELALSVGVAYGPITIRSYDLAWVAAEIRSVSVTWSGGTAVAEITGTNEIELTLTPSGAGSSTLSLFLNGHTTADLLWPILA